MQFYCYLLFISLEALLILKVTAQAGPPSIVDEVKPVVKIAGSNWTIRCVGEQQLSWVKISEDKILTEFDNRFVIDEKFRDKNYEATLSVTNSTYQDTGRYKCQFTLVNSVSDIINVFVFDPDYFFLPTPEGIIFFYENEPEAVIPCVVTNPNISVILFKQPYKKPVDSAHLINTIYDPIRGFLVTNPTKYYSGHFKCEGHLNGSIKKTKRIQLYWKASIRKYPTPSISVSKTTILTKENFSLTCSVFLNVMKITVSKIRWLFPNPHRINLTSNSNFTENIINDTHREYFSYISVNYTEPKDTGNYFCSFATFQNVAMRNSIFITITKRTKPVILHSNLNRSVLSCIKGSDVNLTCVGKGIPPPKIYWHKDSSVLKFDTPGVSIIDNSTQLIISRVTEENNGEYSCLVFNSEGNVSDEVTLAVIEDPSDLQKTKIKETDTVIILWTVSAILCLSVLGIVMVLLYKRKRRHQKLVVLQKLLFEQGDMDCINPDVPLVDQVELLPYDRQWEFCPNNLKLGRVLGQGAFGRVVKAKAYGLLTDENEPIVVAVKLLKERADLSHQKALMQELKIMIHLGRHINVLNLLGACTKRIDKGELMVIMEFCSRGNLRHFLLNHRDGFINQVNPETNNIENGASFLFLLDEDSSSSFQNYKNLSQVRSLSTEGVSSRQNSCNSNQISTTDLIYIAFQIANGMKYISSKQLVHRDLAARNILLTEDYIVKICDFGLAKDLYNYSFYKKKGNGPLPIKWMAIESLKDKIFSTQSDVWSFGIVMWELFTLGGIPYPGVEIDQDFFQKLLDGYRLSKPDFASTDMHLLMLDCWKEKPNDRPTFSQLVTLIGNMLDGRFSAFYANLDNVFSGKNDIDETIQDYILMSEIGDTSETDKLNPNSSDTDFPSSSRNNYLEMDNLRPVSEDDHQNNEKNTDV